MMKQETLEKTVYTGKKYTKLISVEHKCIEGERAEGNAMKTKDAGEVRQAGEGERKAGRRERQAKFFFCWCFG